MNKYRITIDIENIFCNSESEAKTKVLVWMRNGFFEREDLKVKKLK